MQKLILLPFFFQGLFMLVDEFYFHYKRTLPRWEKIGHPIDTFFTLICYAFILLNSPTQQSLIVFGILCLFSSLLITKDEWVHKKECQPGELLVHALLFIAHPLVFVGAGVIWFLDLKNIEWILSFQFALIFIFLVYQILAWNILWKNRK